MDNVKEFLSTISHEIRTPLTSIKGFSKTMLDSYDNLSEEQKRKFLKIIYEQSQRLINLIENALTAANETENNTNFIFKKTDINSILIKSIDLVKMNYKDMSFETNLTKDLYSTLDWDKLQQIFVNILDNASKYSINSNKIEIKTLNKENKNFISVKNFGTTIKEEEKEKIFDKFYRIETYLTSKTQGSGLGLYIVKMLVEKMNGKIEVISDEKNNAVEFIVSFPIFTIEDFTKGAYNV